MQEIFPVATPPPHPKQELRKYQQVTYSKKKIVNKSNLILTDIIPEKLFDQKYLNEKILYDRKRLLSVVQYFKEETCRREFISKYFGIDEKEECGNCDLC